MYTLKQIPEDFIVTEINDIPKESNGKYLYYTLKKKNRNTLDVVKQLSRILFIKEKQIGFAGSKDKHAVTEQMISIQGARRESIENLSVENTSLEFVGYGDKPISLGDLDGNAFTITVRNLTADTIQKLNTTTLNTTSIQTINFCENYFDEQRFSKNNVEIGRLLLKKNFEKAAELADYFACRNHLNDYPHDFVGALKKIPIRLLRMYINAYQSMLWNVVVASYLENHGSVLKSVPYSQGKLVFVKDKIEIAVPIVGFDSQSLGSGEIKELIVNLMKKEKMGYSDFLIKQIPQLSLEGELRDVFIEVKDFILGKVEDDELNPEMKKVKVSFTLPKGSYATIIIKKIFS